MSGNLQLVVRIRADGTAEVVGATRQVERAVGGVDDAARRAGAGARALTTELGQVRNMMAALGATAAGIKVVQWADDWTRAAGRLALVSKSTAQLIATQQRLFDLAQDTRSAYEATVDLYARMSRASRELGLAQSEVLRITETVNKAVKISTLDYGGFAETKARGSLVNYGTAEEAMIGLLKRVLTEASSGADANVLRAASSIQTTDPERFAQLIAFAKQFDASIKMLHDGVIDFAGAVETQAKAQVEAFIAQIKEFKENTAAAGLDTQAAAAATRAYVEAFAGIREVKPALTATEQAVAALKAQFAALGPALQEVGYSAAEAAAALDGQLAAQMQKLRTAYAGDLDKEWLEASGRGYLNQLAALGEQLAQRQRDATALGVDPGLLTRNYSVAVGNVLKSLGVDQLLDVASSGADRRILDLVSAEVMRRDALEGQTAALDAATRATGDWRRALDGLRNMRAAMVLGEFSPLAPLARFEEAQRQWRETLAAAQGGDMAAAERLDDAGQAYLQANRDYWATANPAAFKEVQQGLSSVETMAERELSVAAQHLNVAEQQLAAINGQTATLAQLAEALGKLGVPTEVGGGAGTGGSGGSAGSGSAASGGYYIKANADGSATYYTPGGGRHTVRGPNAYDLLAATYPDAKRMALGGLVGAYEAGGMVGNGLWNRDSVLARYAGGGEIALAGGEWVTRAPSVTADTLPVLSHINRTGRLPGTTDNSGVEQRLDRVAAALERLIGLQGRAGEGIWERLDRLAQAAEAEAAATSLAKARAA